MKYVGKYEKIKGNIDEERLYLVYNEHECIIMGNIVLEEDIIIDDGNPLIIECDIDLLKLNSHLGNKFKVRNNDHIFILDSDEVLSHIVTNMF